MNAWVLYWAEYDRFGSRDQSGPFDSINEAVDHLISGEEYEQLHAVRVLDQDGRTVHTRAEVLALWSER